MRQARRSRAEIEALLAELRLAGSNLAHTRVNNLAHVQRLVDSDPGVTLGIDLIHEQIRQSPLQAEQVLDLISSMTGCSKDMSFTEGLGYISPSAAYEGLRKAAVAIKGAVDQNASFLFATGHPHSMTDAYQDLADYVSACGCEVVGDDPSGVDEYHGQKLELLGSVYVVTVAGLPAHTHRHEHMRDLLNRIPPVGMAVADHGFAGAALNLGIPTVCVMDTNDPGVAVAAALGAPVTVVPLNDNSPREAVREIAGIIEEFIEGLEQ